MAVTTSVEPLEGNKVRLHVAVPAADFERAIDAAFRKLAKEVKLPGFRPGKAPRQLLEARLGTEAARDQALRDSLPDYYAEAVVSESIDVIAAPEIDITAGEDDGDVEFDAVVEVRPEVTLEGYDALTVEIPSPAVPDDAVDAQIDMLRDRFAELTDSETPLVDGDYAEIDVKGSIGDEAIEGLTATDYVYEVGSGLVVAELDAELHGKRPGDILKFEAVLPERFGERAGDEVSFQVLVKDAKRKVLPEVTDEWATEVSEFDTAEALRGDIAARLDVYAKVQAQLAVREKVLDAAAELVTVDIPDTLVSQEMERRLHDMAHRLEEQFGQGITVPQYLALTGQDQEEFVTTLRETATRSVRSDLALRAVIVQEAVEIGDDEIDGEIQQLATRTGEKPERIRKDLERQGLVGAVASDLARGKALNFLIEHATVVDEDGNPVDLTPPEQSPDETPAEALSAPEAPADDEQEEQEESAS
jgi:trigger factor